MQGVFDFLSFRYFISPFLLLLIYYTGVLVIPLMIHGMRHRLQGLFGGTGSPTPAMSRSATPAEKSEARDDTRAWPADSSPAATRSPGLRARIWLLFFLVFLGMELLWRMMFEFLIAYLQIWNSLQILSHATLV